MAKQFSKPNAFLTFVWRFLGSNTLEQVEFKLEKIIEIYPPTCTGKVKSGILLPKLFLPIVSKKNSSDQEKFLRSIYSNSVKSEYFFLNRRLF